MRRMETNSRGADLRLCVIVMAISRGHKQARFQSHKHSSSSVHSWRASGMEKPWGSDDWVNTRTAGSVKSILGRENENRHLDFPISPSNPCKGDQTSFIDMFLKGRIFNLLDRTSSQTCTTLKIKWKRVYKTFAKHVITFKITCNITVCLEYPINNIWWWERRDPLLNSRASGCSKVGDAAIDSSQQVLFEEIKKT